MTAQAAIAELKIANGRAFSAVVLDTAQWQRDLESEHLPIGILFRK
jgi:hypothetical protein